MKILITGAAGYQAGFIIERLRANHALTLFDLVAPKASDLFIQGDITNYNDVRQACEGQEAVVHLVALVRGREGKPHGLFADVMVKGTWNVAEACVSAGVQRLVNISSIAATGWPSDRNRCYGAADHCGFVSRDIFYSLSKNLGEGIVRAYHEGHGLSAINLRPGVISGDGVNGEPTAPKGDRPPHWFVYVHPEDVAQAVELAVETDKVDYGTYYVVAGRPDSWFNWQEPADALGYDPQHNWEEI